MPEPRTLRTFSCGGDRETLGIPRSVRAGSRVAREIEGNVCPIVGVAQNLTKRTNANTQYEHSVDRHSAARGAMQGAFLNRMNGEFYKAWLFTGDSQEPISVCQSSKALR